LITRPLKAALVFAAGTTLILVVMLVVATGSLHSRAYSRPVGPAPAVVSATPKPSGPSLDAYRGLGSWVDIYDDPAWRDPAGAVRDMASHGVTTLYVETGHYNMADPLFKPAALREFIAEAHARKMRVVAWYLPNMKSRSVDYDRIAQAVRLHTADGQHFDSFALDIESTAISSYAARNAGLEALTKRIRKLVGPTTRSAPSFRRRWV